MKIRHFIVLIIILIFSIDKINTKEVDNETKEKEKKIMDKIDEILKKNEELNLLIMKTNSSLNKINEKSEILNKALNNIKTVYKEENNQNNYIKNFVCFFCIVIILAISIYILELKYEKQNNKSEKNIELNNNNIKGKENEDTKLYFSI